MLEGMARLHDHVSKALGPSHLRCEQCGHTETPSPNEVANYLRVGWPRHCDRTMTFEFVSEART